MRNDRGKSILPIRRNITKKEVQAFSSILAGRLALRTASMIPAEIAAELGKILGFYMKVEDIPHG